MEIRPVFPQFLIIDKDSIDKLESSTEKTKPEESINKASVEETDPYDLDLIVKNGGTPTKINDTDDCTGTGTYANSCRGSCASCTCTGTYSCS